ncbi:hypothetical protein BC008_07425 [Mastigocoleus testarum BC008]|uniref:Uncharacterized protein n=1 Tax=Mastigocoleus testarum BC008 TaxID=371196 RepID=A0A0V7ZBH4_9CYAN|nr:hypothetical protein BC008_07425 [Mastigocoleus testarum BC008]
MQIKFSNRKVISTIVFVEILVIGSALLRAMLLNLNPRRYFAEQGYVSWVSFLQILIVAYLSWKTFESRKSTATSMNLKASYNLWAILSLGFLFLGLDEIFELHESLDYLIHDWFQIQQTEITDRIDSLIVLIYALFGVGILYWAKSELKKFKSAFTLFGIAFGLIFMMILFDFLTDSRDFFRLFFVNSSTVDMAYHSLIIIEESCKIFAGGMFIAAFHHCLQISKTLKKSL